jgi:cullin-associated NEDD8-dissociated protein 1
MGTGCQLGDQLKQAALLIKARAVVLWGTSTHSTACSMSLVTITGFDTHSDSDSDMSETLTANLNSIDSALASFSEEPKAQGLWQNVTLMAASDFGRMLTSNGAGTDHAVRRGLILKS